MSAAKIALIAGGAIVVLFVALGVAGYLWFRQNSERLTEQGKIAMREGARFGSGKPAQACVDEALRRLTAETGLVDEALNKQFFSACLKTANVTPDFCAGVPPRGEIVQTATWAVNKCAELARHDQECTRLVGAIQERCLASR